MLDKLANAVGLGNSGTTLTASALNAAQGTVTQASNPYLTQPQILSNGNYGAQLGGSYTDEMLVNIQVSIADNGFIFRMGRRTVIATKLEDLTDTFTSSIASVMLERQDK